MLKYCHMSYRAFAFKCVQGGIEMETLYIKFCGDVSVTSQHIIIQIYTKSSVHRKNKCLKINAKMHLMCLFCF